MKVNLLSVLAFISFYSTAYGNENDEIFVKRVCAEHPPLEDVARSELVLGDHLINIASEHAILTYVNQGEDEVVLHVQLENDAGIVITMGQKKEMSMPSMVEDFKALKVGDSIKRCCTKFIGEKQNGENYIYTFSGLESDVVMFDQDSGREKTNVYLNFEGYEDRYIKLSFFPKVGCEFVNISSLPES